MDLRTQVLYSQVRVKTPQAGGSGTIIYSKGASTYILSCHHVISGVISVKREWDSRLGRDHKREFRQVVGCEFFEYENIPHGNRPINYSVDADLIAWDKDHDLALLKLRTNKQAKYVAKLPLPDDVVKFDVGAKLAAVGCALLHDPILTEGIITHQGDEMDFKDYWMGSAQIIFGNSGGAVFSPLDNVYNFVGVPSRVAVVGWGSPITHLGYFSPVSRIYKFFEEQLFHFLIPGHEHTEEICVKERIKLVEEEAKRITSDDSNASPLLDE